MTNNKLPIIVITVAIIVLAVAFGLYFVGLDKSDNNSSKLENTAIDSSKVEGTIVNNINSDTSETGPMAGFDITTGEDGKTYIGDIEVVIPELKYSLDNGNMTMEELCKAYVDLVTAEAKVLVPYEGYMDEQGNIGSINNSVNNTNYKLIISLSYSNPDVADFMTTIKLQTADREIVEISKNNRDGYMEYVYSVANQYNLSDLTLCYGDTDNYTENVRLNTIVKEINLDN